jgi:hypothetical protein
MKKIIAATKKLPFKPYENHHRRLQIGLPRQFTVTTPIPVCEMRGDEWDTMHNNWVIEIYNQLKNFDQDKKLRAAVFCSDHYRKLMKMYKGPGQPMLHTVDHYWKQNIACSTSWNHA